MNLLHPLSEPAWFTIAIMAAALVVLLWGVHLYRKANKLTPDLPYIEIDELQRLIDQRNAHCRIKAEYDYRG